MAAAKVAFEEERRRSDAWCRSRPGYVIDYDALCRDLERERRENEAAQRGVSRARIKATARA